ncbi:DUF4174 domain-containing protein [Fibrella forsythiae]|uniref:DUF4174 domain-containing protein n=1 Tax=Fibrella forsythiae TaxID=2817061 RepID=A0ABS3JB34_9BACT|nr:DUF4174 domain-containing protein [Fibrella forsythiae]MBO0947195.1 DUF4174 domain-containing protein [Fibrella forsythiae]
MMNSSILLISLLGGLLSITAPGVAQSLESTVAAKKWQRRVLLIYARDAQHADLAAQKRFLADHKAGLAERDFDQLVVLDGDLSDRDWSYLRGGDRKLAQGASFMLFLIGKDGGVKERFPAPVAASVLFRTVDTMPMRQSEMRKKN